MVFSPRSIINLYVRAIRRTFFRKHLERRWGVMIVFTVRVVFLIIAISNYNCHLPLKVFLHNFGIYFNG